MKQATDLIQLLRERHLYIGSCESFTAGLFCSQMAEVPGVSQVLKGGLVTYATTLKSELANVDARIIETFGVISAECAKAMALGAKEALQVDICVSFTGNAGPDGMEGKPAGLVYIGICYQDDVYCFEIFKDLSRNDLRKYAVQKAIQYSIEILTKKEERYL